MQGEAVGVSSAPTFMSALVSEERGSERFTVYPARNWSGKL
jgi:hypothetical protein